VKTLITGVSSCIGQGIAKQLVTQGIDVVGFDIRKSKILSQDVTFIEGDVRNIEDLVHAAVGCTSGIHLAVKADSSDPETTLSVNVLGAYAFLIAAKQALFKNTIIVSSAPVHLPSTQITENKSLETSEDEDHLYDLTKILQEVIAKDFHTHGLPVMCLRFGHVVRGEEELSLKRNCELRNLDYCRGGWVALEDVVQACAAALKIKPDRDKWEILNIIGSKRARRRFNVADAEARLGIRLNYNFKYFD